MAYRANHAGCIAKVSCNINLSSFEPEHCTVQLHRQKRTALPSQFLCFEGKFCIKQRLNYSTELIYIRPSSLQLVFIRKAFYEMGLDSTTGAICRTIYAWCYMMCDKLQLRRLIINSSVIFSPVVPKIT